jgi:hypothetical protein
MLRNRLLSGCVGVLAIALSSVGAVAAGHGGGGGGHGGGGGFHGGGGGFHGGFAGRGYGGGARLYNHRREAFFGGPYDVGYGDDCFWRGRRWVCPGN